MTFHKIKIKIKLLSAIDFELEFERSVLFRRFTFSALVFSIFLYARALESTPFIFYFMFASIISLLCLFSVVKRIFILRRKRLLVCEDIASCSLFLGQLTPDDFRNLLSLCLSSRTKNVVMDYYIKTRGS